MQQKSKLPALEIAAQPAATGAKKSSGQKLTWILS